MIRFLSVLELGFPDLAITHACRTAESFRLQPRSTRLESSRKQLETSWFPQASVLVRIPLAHIR